MPTFAEISAAAEELLADPVASDTEERAEQLRDTDLLLSLVWNWGIGGLQYTQVLLINRLREHAQALAAAT